jgi:exosortase A-associated hydrolase 1
MRQMIGFDCGGDRLAATLDEAKGSTGLLIVSGGNEIRSGAHSGQSAMARHFATLGYPVFRYDRRGIGDSEGVNGGFEASADDIAAAIDAFRANASHIKNLVAFGNCDAATALALFHRNLAIDGLILANPWVIEAETSKDEARHLPSAAAIRSRYWTRLKNPRSWLNLLTGKIDLKKLAGGLARAAQRDEAGELAHRVGQALAISQVRTDILIADKDTTALAFLKVWKSANFAGARNEKYRWLHSFDTPSHSFADASAKAWLYKLIREALAERG